MRIQGKLIGLLAGDAEFARNVFRAEAHADVRVGRVVHEPGIRRNLVAAHGHHGHGLGAARHDDVRGAAANAFGGERNRLQAGGAEAVDGHRGSFHGQAGAEASDARDVHALLAFGHGAAENHVVDFLWLETGNAGKGLFDCQPGEIVGARGAQRAFVGAAYGSADGRNNHGFRHGKTSQSESEIGNPKIENGLIPHSCYRIHCWPRREKMQLWPRVRIQEYLHYPHTPIPPLHERLAYPCCSPFVKASRRTN